MCVNVETANEVEAPSSDHTSLKYCFALTVLVNFKSNLNIT